MRDRGTREAISPGPARLEAVVCVQWPTPPKCMLTCSNSLLTARSVAVFYLNSSFTGAQELRLLPGLRLEETGDLPLYNIAKALLRFQTVHCVELKFN